jgi:hypothetical protein
MVTTIVALSRQESCARSSATWWALDARARRAADESSDPCTGSSKYRSCLGERGRRGSRRGSPASLDTLA